MTDEKTNIRDNEKISEMEIEMDDENICQDDDEIQGDVSEESTPSESLTEDQKLIAALTEEKENLKDSLLRKVAEFENLKRRTTREKEEAVKYGSAAVLSSMLEVIDNFDRAFENEPTQEDFHSFFVGVKLIARNMKEVLNSHGLEELDPLGEQFDPFYHEAMMREETPDNEDNEVMEVFQKGYKLKDRLLRPARVKVAVKIQKTSDEENTQTPQSNE